MCDAPNKLKKLFYEILNDYKIYAPCPYGDGTSSKRISDILNNL